MVAYGGGKITFVSGGKNVLYRKENIISRVRKALDTGSGYSCQDTLDAEAEKKITKFPFPLKNDKNMDLQLFFVGENSETQLLLTTMRQNFLSVLMHHHISSHLYQSTDGGRTFQKIRKANQVNFH